MKEFKNYFGWLTCCQTKATDWFALSIDCLFENSNIIIFGSWVSFNWFHNRIRSCFKCFDQDLNNINSLLIFYNKQLERKTYLNFQRAFKHLSFSLWALVIQERSGIGLLCIDFSWLCNSVICSGYCVHSGVVKPRRVVCSWGCQDQHSWYVCAESKQVCFLRGSRSLLWWCVYVIWFWLPSGFPSGFWETGCSSWFKSEPV